MGALTQYYCDPAIAADSGTGTSGDPFGDLQYALNNITRDATNGDKINVKAGTAEALSGALSIATYGTPAAAAPLVIRGYTSAANDGGIGEISGGGSVAILASNGRVHFVDMKLGNCGSAVPISNTSIFYLYNCEIHGTSGNGIAGGLGSSAIVIGCYLHNIGGIGIGTASPIAIGNYLANGTNDFTAGIVAAANGLVERNIISIDGSSVGIQFATAPCKIIGNSILSAGGTGVGIDVTGSNLERLIICNNLIEGFSGGGGQGIDFNSTTVGAGLFAGNAIYNCATAYANAGDFAELFDLDNETLGATPFAKSGSDTFASRFTYFRPVSSGNVLTGAYPFDGALSKGAVQYLASGGGVIIRPSAMQGGF